jgi:hypothetical protein
MMTKIVTLLRDMLPEVHVPRPATDPFVDSEALHEGTLLSVLSTTEYPVVAVLIDLRTSMHFDTQIANTGVLIFRGVSQVVNSCRREKSPKVWLIGDSSISYENSEVRTHIRGLLWDETITVWAQSVEFVVGLVEGIGEVAAEMADGQMIAYWQTIQNWESELQIKGLSTTANMEDLPNPPNGRSHSGF